MKITISTMVANIRKAIDDIAPSVLDSFASDVDAELKQALMHAVESLSMELPLSLLEPQVADNNTVGDTDSEFQITSEDGDETMNVLVLPKDFIRFFALKMDGWKGTVRELIEPGSDEEKRQRSSWGSGTPTKPKAMLDNMLVETDEDSEERRVIRYWPNSSTLVRFVYINRPVEGIGTDAGKIICNLREETEKNIIYRAAYIFLEGKKESATADKFNQLSML